MKTTHLILPIISLAIASSLVASAQPKASTPSPALIEKVPPKIFNTLPSSEQSPYGDIDPVVLGHQMKVGAESYKTADKGDAEYKANDIPDAIAAYQKARLLEPNNMQAIYGLARCAAQEKDYPDALRYFRRVIYSHMPASFAVPDWGAFLETHNDHLMEYAKFLNKIGHVAEAVFVYNHAINLFDYDYPTHVANYPVLLPQIGQGAGQTPYTPQRLEGMATLALGVEDEGFDGYSNDNTINYYRKALSLMPDSAVANYYIGRYYYGGVENQQAIPYLKRAIQFGNAQAVTQAKILLKEAEY